jgi:hypothetical protein
MRRIGAEQQKSHADREQKTEARHRQQQVRHRRNRNRAPQSEHPQIERQDRSHQHDEAEDVQDLDRGIKRGRAAHHMTQRAFLQGQEDRRGRLMFHSRLPQFDALAVENDVFDARLIRIAGMGIAEHGAGLAGAIMSGVMPRRSMRAGGASTKRQCLRSTSISISQCGFSKVDFRISPVTVNDFDVSYPPQP